MESSGTRGHLPYHSLGHAYPDEEYCTLMKITKSSSSCYSSNGNKFLRRMCVKCQKPAIKNGICQGKDNNIALFTRKMIIFYVNVQFLIRKKCWTVLFDLTRAAFSGAVEASRGRWQMILPNENGSLCEGRWINHNRKVRCSKCSSYTAAELFLYV